MNYSTLKREHERTIWKHPIDLSKAISKEWFQYILDNPDKRWDYIELSKNPNITWEMVQAHPHIQWYYSILSSNPNITWEIVQANPDKPWNYYWLSINTQTKFVNHRNDCLKMIRLQSLLFQCVKN